MSSNLVWLLTTSHQASWRPQTMILIFWSSCASNWIICRSKKLCIPSHRNPHGLSHPGIFLPKRRRNVWLKSWAIYPAACNHLSIRLRMSFYQKPKTSNNP
nr:hypothetical protein I308_04585 [Cryptococcus tetragattii IND107]